MRRSRLELLLLVLWFLYLLWPIDLLPDYLGFLGRLDELALLAYLIYRSRKSRTEEQEANKRGPESSASNGGKSQTPYEVLEISPGASRDQIEKAYRKLAAQYHPDKVSHLGIELQHVAHEKMIKIQWAYSELTK